MPAAQFSISFDSALGPVCIRGTERGVSDVRFAKALAEDSPDAPIFFEDCHKQVTEYLTSKRRTFTDLPLCIRGTGFQQDVWKRAMEIPFGATATYGELAKDLDDTAAQAGHLTLNPMVQMGWQSLAALLPQLMQRRRAAGL